MSGVETPTMVLPPVIPATGKDDTCGEDWLWRRFCDWGVQVR